MTETGSDEIISLKVNSLPLQDDVDGKLSESLPTEKCGKHSSELLNMYCGRDKTLCCTVCISLDHKSCNDQVVCIKTAAKNVAKSNEYSDVKEKLKSSLQNCVKHVTKRSRDKERLFKEKKEAQAKIDDFKSKIKKQVDIYADNALKEVDRRYELFNKAIVQDIESIESMIARIEAEMIRLHKKENECELFTSVKKGISLTKECEVIDNEMCRNIGQEKITVAEDEHLYESLCLKSNIVHFIEVDPQPVSVHTDKLVCVEHKTTIKLRDIIKDRNCDLSDVSCLKNGNIVVSDKTNYKLWLLNDSLEVTSELKIDGEPSYTCATADDEIAVAIYANSYDSYISFFKVKNSVLVECRKLFLTRPCRGLCSKENTVFASYNRLGFGMMEVAGGRLLKFSRSGELQDDVNYDQMEKPGKVAFGTASNYLYIIDEKKGLVCYDHLSGKRIFVEPTLKYTKAICVDKHNRLFVVDKSSQTIVQLTAFGKTVGTLLKSSDGICFGKALCYDQSREMLITLMRKSTIAVYRVRDTEPKL